MSLWMMEKLPYPSQSTLIILLVNFIYSLNVFLTIFRETSLRLFFFGLLVAAVVYLTYHFNIYKRINFFKMENTYVSMLKNCEGKTVQSWSIGAIIRPLAPGALFHPLFIKDYTYFGYFQDHLLLDNFEEIVAHRKQEPMNYIESIEPCFIDTHVAAILTKEIPGLQLSPKGYVPSPQTRTVGE